MFFIWGKGLAGDKARLPPIFTGAPTFREEGMVMSPPHTPLIDPKIEKTAQAHGCYQGKLSGEYLSFAIANWDKPERGRFSS